MTFGDVVAPMPLQEFLTRHVGKRYAYINGERGRFAHLASWDDINAALSRLRITDDERVSLVRNGKKLDVERFTYSTGHALFLDGSAVAHHASEGATLVVTQIEELLPAVRTLVESFEDSLCLRPSANLYAGWRMEKGFAIHWDKHDTLVVQVIGRKQWTVWEPTRPFPLRGDDATLVPRPKAQPIWEGTMEDGDALYMPRGWWHVAVPMDEPSLHVTIGIRHPTGIDLLIWCAEQMKANPMARMDVPSWLSADERHAWTRSLCTEFSSQLRDSLVEDFVASRIRSASSLPIVSLPERVWNSRRVDDLTPIRLKRGSRLVFRVPSQAGELSFVTQRGEFRCDAQLGPALKLLNHVKACTLMDMSCAIAPEKRVHLRAMISALVIAEVVWLQPS